MNFSKLIWCEPWLAPVALNLQNVIETESIETAGVTPDGKTLYYNPHFWKGLNKEERLAVQIHEMLHIVNRHAARKDDRHHTLWNIAGDITINYQIKVSGYSLPSDALKGENDTAENIYDRLLQKINLQSGGMSGKKKSFYSGSDGGCNGYNYPEFDPDAIDKASLARDLLQRNADGSENDSNSSTLEAIESAVRLAGRGSSRLAKLFKPRPAKADWRSILRHYVKSVIGDDLDYISYEFDEFGICEDILSAKPIPTICVLVDESGSIDDELYEQFLGELSKMSRLACVYASGFTDNTELNVVPLEKYRRTMTGGTDVRLAYNQACQKDFDCIIVLTDGFLEFPEREIKPTVWAMPEGHQRRLEVII